MIAILRALDLTKLPAGTEVSIRILATSTGRYRTRIAFTNDRQRQILDRALEDLRARIGADAQVEVAAADEASTFPDLALDLQLMAGENLATSVLRALDAGADKKL